MTVIDFKGAARPKQAHRSELSTFTGQRLDWERCLRFDRRIRPLDYEVACAIASFTNVKANGTASISDEAIADETGIALRSIYPARKRLRNAGWLTWRRTLQENVYTLQFGQVSGFLDALIVARERRKKLRKKRGPNRLRDYARERSLKISDYARERNTDYARERNVLPRLSPYKDRTSKKDSLQDSDSLSGRKKELVERGNGYRNGNGYDYEVSPDEADTFEWEGVS